MTRVLHGEGQTQTLRCRAGNNDHQLARKAGEEVNCSPPAPAKEIEFPQAVYVCVGDGGGALQSVGTQPRQELVKAEKQKLAATSPLAIPRDDVHRNWWQLPPCNGF